MPETQKSGPGLRLIGESPISLYGLPAAEWQRRAWAHAGARGGDDDGAGAICIDIGWALSAGLASALAASPGAALLADGAQGRRLIAAHAPASADIGAVAALVAQGEADEALLADQGLRPASAAEIAGDYNQVLRKREVPFAVEMAAEGPRATERAFFRSAYKGATDIVTKFAWPIPAFAATRFCAARGITPNAVTALSFVFVLLAMWFFWRGEWTAGFVSGWFMTFLDTVDGKLARTTFTSSRWGNIFDHGIDQIHPPFWYWAWFEGIRATTPNAPDWLDLALWTILVFYLLGRLVETVFMRRFGFHMHIWRRIDYLMRTVTARRNPNMLIFMVFCMFGAAAEGLAAVALWAVVCVGFHAVRLAMAFRVARGGVVASWMIGSASK
ncbi:CDP-alcohol phosphatidyltransferase family protein [Pikeienuella piscinae]|uniref:CDP-alcohol phosphatidyltransferase family protein n=1 Tax=Pikeienuella piscinae TaxID=2748098 RepID=A0A7L5C2U7_9RHOB|nr:CDP-alcohol phosphatidyltransferase family protein [Pikeienuella piscinae]QIE56886.1 CDP-alcohol phosphatidyltransferase family protein [Pikeienuella piscinae]